MSAAKGDQIVGADGVLREFDGQHWQIVTQVLPPERAEVSTPKKAGKNAKKDRVPERTLPFRTAAELCAEAPEDVPWIVPGYIPEGALVELCGKVKIGKTTFVATMVRQVLDGGTFLGNPVAQGKVVWLTEQPTTSFADALRGAGLEAREDLVLLQWVDARGIAWEKVAQEATKKAQDIGAILLLVDTISQFSGIKGDGENSAGEAQRAIEPLQVAAAEGLGVVVCRHERKGGGEIGDSGRGSSAWSGAVDVILKLTRPEGSQRESLRVLEVSGRFRDAPPEQVIELRGGLYHALGTSQDVAAQEAREKILVACSVPADQGLSVTDLVEKLKLKRTTCQMVVERMVKDGVLARTGEGKPRKPFRHHQPEPGDSFGRNSISRETVPAESKPTPENHSARTPAGSGRSIGPPESSCSECGRPLDPGDFGFEHADCKRKRLARLKAPRILEESDGYHEPEPDLEPEPDEEPELEMGRSWGREDGGGR